MCIYILLFCCAKMSLREVERWLPKVFLVYFVAKQLRIEWSSLEFLISQKRDSLFWLVKIPS